MTLLVNHFDVEALAGKVAERTRPYLRPGLTVTEEAKLRGEILVALDDAWADYLDRLTEVKDES